ncbi:ThiF family adenylyltransferase [Bradyrhizobium symbiodeficiens]|uniref:ThiF family adenylyltransferase n=1 Tax=Bradyrhizobium symbiodeficiens TaxID=1404367 RepID=A0ABX5W4A6_9BRAD|nr:ThiF family adenylyltransferase [Bradyrhizobium symbiodeficiens]QDF37444.1 ThiF family adenylyltransferase [Bradyrhizobium symbiodeficiens]
MSRLDRQSFLGANSDAILEGATIGIVGLGGGGSHVAQQTAHMGVGGYVNADPDVIEDTNTNRLIGGTLADVDARMPKVAIAARLIRGLDPGARIISVQDDWHNAVADLKRCTVIVGAVDGFREREQLERFARRHLIPYIDIGMDVHDLGKQGYLVSGQVILSMPGAPCMRCCGFITDERLEQEARKYGAAGSRPQVVWSNGVLASTAVGLLTQVLTPWYANPPAFVFLDYDGNKGTVTRNARMDLLKDHVCPHHPPDETGDPLFDIRKQNFAPRPVPAPPSIPPLPWWRRLWIRLTGWMS